MSKRPFFLRVDGVLKKIDLDEIIFLQTAKNYVKFHLLKTTLLVRTTLAEALEKLPPDEFLRVHRFFVVSVNHIDKIGGDLLSLTGREDLIPVSRNYFEKIARRINALGFDVPDEEVRDAGTTH
jgi:DNA-binding LytR/AlgR family response regulator